MNNQTMYRVPKQMQPAFERITSLTDEFCAQHLDEAHAELCRKMAAALGRKRPSPIGRGRPEGWACGIVLAVGSQNFLFDKTTEPCVRAADIAAHFGVALSTGDGRARVVREALDIKPLDAEWNLKSVLGNLSVPKLIEMGVIRLPEGEWPGPEGFAGQEEVEVEMTPKEALFAAEAAYAESILHQALGDIEKCIRSLRLAHEILPTYPPVVVALGSVEYQLDNSDEGRRLFHSLLELPDDDSDLDEMIDGAGGFLIEQDEYADGLDLYRAAVRRFPEADECWAGLCCCAGHVGENEEAIAAARTACRLEPEKQTHVNDLGWCLFEADRFVEAEEVLSRAVEMDPDDDLAAENLRICSQAME